MIIRYEVYKHAYSTRIIQVNCQPNYVEEKTMQEFFAGIIESIGEDLTRPGLVDTPKRAAKAFQFLTRGYQQNIDDVVYKKVIFLKKTKPPKVRCYLKEMTTYWW